MRRLLFSALLLLAACGPGAEVRSGRELYLAYGCAACHGPDADGRGPGAPLSHFKPSDLTNLDGYRGASSEEGIASTIAFGVAQGRTGMPGYPDIPKKERLAIAQYIRSLAIEPSQVRVSAAWIRSPNPAVDVTGGYLTITNPTSGPVTVVAASSPHANIVEMHETKTVDGMMMMEKVEELLVPANGSVRLEPGGTHLMLIGLSRPFPRMSSIKFRFDDGTTLTATAEVRDE